jgi:dTDP-4-dehydrorhamnose reductase
MIILLGASGYVGTSFRNLFLKNGIEHLSISRRNVNYYDKDQLHLLIKTTSPQFLINAAGYTGKPNVDACEIYKAECVRGNILLPGILKETCQEHKLPWGHVSSGCIYTGNTPDGDGFTEKDQPNFCFRTNNCSFYSGCKALGEECLTDADSNYIWRLRIPFNNIDSSRNYLSKLLRYDRLLNAANSISHLDEFTAACYQSFKQKIPFGIYNMTNPGAITTEGAVALIKKTLKPNREFRFFFDEREFMQLAANTPRSNCVLNSSKLLSCGIHMSHSYDAIEKSLMNWIPE